MQVAPHFVSGERLTKDSEVSSIVYNPAQGEGVAQVNHADLALVEQTIYKAKIAQATWALVPPVKRTRLLNRFATLVKRDEKKLIHLISMEHGKTLQDAKGELARGLEIVEFATGIPQLLKGEYSPQVGTDVDSYSQRAPVGVVVGITPFNFPAMVGMWMFPMALACGNSFIWKPSEKVPSAAVALAELLIEAGIPKDVMHVLQGGQETATHLIQSPDTHAISFVGSTPVAKAIYEMGTSHGKRVQALGGAKNHAIVMPDADLSATVDGIMGAAFGSAGQRCMAISVVVAVGDKMADNLVTALCQEMEEMVLGPYDQPTAQMGPINSAQQLSNIKRAIEQGQQEGATLVKDGRQHKTLPKGPGYYLGPTLFDHVTADMTIYQEEIFGPVLAVVRAKDFDEALVLVNKHPFGNGATIFTQDGHVAREFSQKVQAGMVGINVPIPVPVASFSFGGWKQSLFGDLHMYGPEGVHFYTKHKVVTSRWYHSDKLLDKFVMPHLI